jgi:mitogen-activated protein kinase kinase kinase
LSIFGFLSGRKFLINATTLATRVANWHPDIKGANILVDNRGCIKLADLGASKKVVKLATISEAKPMKGTPYWMAPEDIRQTGHKLAS